MPVEFFDVDKLHSHRVDVLSISDYAVEQSGDCAIAVVHRTSHPSSIVKIAIVSSIKS